MLLTIALLILGFVLLIFGASLLVKGATALAARLGVPDLVIGLTVVAFGTSLPEMTVNTFNSIKELNDAVFGNVIGSNNFNILFILGITGLIFPIKVEKQTVAYEVPFSLAITFILLALINDQWFGNATNKFGYIDSILMLGCFSIFIFYIFRSLKKAPDEGKVETEMQPYYLLLIYLVIGLVLLVFGGYLITENAVVIANHFGLSQKLIALTILSIGTSLPELATSAVAAYKKNASIAVGNVVGSNIFNIAFILGISGIIHPVNYDQIMNIDIYALLFGSMILMMAMFTGVRRRLDRWEAGLLLLVYVLYTVYILYRN